MSVIRTRTLPCARRGQSSQSHSAGLRSLGAFPSTISNRAASSTVAGHASVQTPRSPQHAPWSRGRSSQFRLIDFQTSIKTATRRPSSFTRKAISTPTASQVGRLLRPAGLRHDGHPVRLFLVSQTRLANQSLLTDPHAGDLWDRHATLHCPRSG